MNNSIKRKVLAVGIVALFAFATTIGATFAWFTIGQSTDMDSIQLTVSSSTSLLIRMDDPLQDYGTPAGEAFYKNPLNYVSTLDNGTILAAYPFNNIRMRTVTSTDGEVITYRDPLDPLPSSSADTLGEGQYIEFKVWVLSQSNSVIVALQDYTITATNTNTNKDDVINAIRTSFTAGSTTLIYGIDKDYDFQFSVNDVGYDSDTPENNMIGDGLDTALIALHGEYYTTTGSGVDGESVDITDGGIAAATTLMQLTADVPVQVTIRIWIEGWDADSDNNVIKSQFNLAFTFAVKQVL